MKKVIYALISSVMALGVAVPAMAHENRSRDRHDRQHEQLEDKHDNSRPNRRPS